MTEDYTVHSPSRGPSDDQVSLLINMQREGEIAFQLRDIAQAQFLRRYSKVGRTRHDQAPPRTLVVAEEEDPPARAKAVLGFRGWHSYCRASSSFAELEEMYKLLHTGDLFCPDLTRSTAGVTASRRGSTLPGRKQSTAVPFQGPHQL